MTTDDPILRELADADPAIGRTDADPEQSQRVLRYALSDRAPARRGARSARATRRRWLTPALGTLSVLVVAAVVVVAVGVGRHGGSPAAPAAARSVTLVYRMQPTPQAPTLTSAAVDRELTVIRKRLHGQPVYSRVTRIGADEIKLTFSGSHLSEAAATRIGLRVAATDSMETYDWEANALLSSGQTVTSQLASRTPQAVTLSQGTASAPPGTVDTGGLTLYQAVELASSQPTAPTSARLSRLGAEYFSFGAPGSAACATAATDRGTVPPAGEYCYLAGPASDASALESELPRGVSPTDGKVLKVPQGVVVLQASNQGGIGIGAPAARFFVLRDRVAVSGGQIIDPRVSSDGGYPSVEFGFTPSGRREFQSVTATVAHRGQMISSGVVHLFQHFAMELDGRLLAVPQIDFVRYPDGVIETARLNEAAIPAASRQQARQVVSELRMGSLPLTLQPVSEAR
jgi:hypothetical protein